MSRRWLLSRFCLAVPLLLFVQLTRAGGLLRVNEAGTTLIIERDRAQILLAIENLSGESLNSKAEGLVDLQSASTEPKLLTPSPNLPPSIASGSQPPPNMAPAQSGIAQLPTPTPPANQTNDTLIRSGLIFLLKEKDRYGVWYSPDLTGDFDGLRPARYRRRF